MWTSINVLSSVGHYTRDNGGEPLAIEVALVALHQAIQPCRLVGIGEAHDLTKAGKVCPGDNKLVLGPDLVEAFAAFPIRQQRRLGFASLAVEYARNAKTQQHALYCFQARQIGLCKPDAHALALIALHAAVGVEKAPQESTVTVARGCLQ